MSDLCRRTKCVPPRPARLQLLLSNADNASGQAQAPPPADLVLYVPQLEVFFNVTGAADVTIAGLGFRDQRRALMEPWCVPCSRKRGNL